jgi:hypothetical protein
VVLAAEAYANFYVCIDHARAEFGLERIGDIAADAQRCLEAALAGIEEWLDVVYNQGKSPEEADFELFIGKSERVKGLGYRIPSQVLDQEVSQGSGG